MSMRLKTPLVILVIVFALTAASFFLSAPFIRRDTTSAMRRELAPVSLFFLTAAVTVSTVVSGVAVKRFKKIERMMNELSAGTARLEASLCEALRAVRGKSNFPAGVSHETEAAKSLKIFPHFEKKHRWDSKPVRLNLTYARVLIVDDLATNLAVARSLMKPYNMRIDCVSSGWEAVDAVRAERVRYDAVFIDYMMPGMDGIETARLIRGIGTDYAKTVPLIALTADDTEGIEKMFLTGGFQAFIPKPIQMTRLDAVIREWVRDKEQERLNEGRQKKSSEQRSGIDRRTPGKGISGLDAEDGIELFNGDENSYIEVLRSYAENMPPLLESLKEVKENNLADYAIAVHGIKGASRGICANTLGRVAETLEKAAKAGDYDFVAFHNKAFLETAWKLVSEIDEMFSQT